MYKSRYDLGAGSRRFKSSRPDQILFNVFKGLAWNVVSSQKVRGNVAPIHRSDSFGFPLFLQEEGTYSDTQFDR